MYTTPLGEMACLFHRFSTYPQDLHRLSTAYQQVINRVLITRPLCPGLSWFVHIFGAR